MDEIRRSIPLPSLAAMVLLGKLDRAPRQWKLPREA
jgi:hypothetical protein